MTITGFHTETIDITPHLAAEWLERNTSNRPMSRMMVSQLAEAMRRGEWLHTHQGIAFDTNGALVDGQHRLAAVVKSGCTVRMQVSHGVEPSTFAVLDTGRKRSARDVLSLQGEENAAYLASALRVHHLYTTAPNSAWTGGSAQVTNEQIVEFLAAHPNMRASVELARTLNRAFRILVPAAAVGHYLTCAERPDIDQLDWIEGLETGANLAEHDPRLMLRNVILRLSAGKSAAKADGSRNQLHLYLKAWNAWVHGTQFRQLNIKAGESMPMVTTRPKPV
ncbi:hypothetical protein [Nocardia seriolae]|uniref:ParB/Sulfiredoxin domain-containing protein n=1 Tax=Nocardia seriolae TaxID=37332 RepID=A0A0B8N3G0_9NOCA|nr:hypothetical protein [Nocardia seriolae]APA97277.1 hypothetical protein NS506_03224 [Nocardia seriolae]MTJ62193.1 hypothetical protein [Nocardia seriolae]MTJ74562.1 hypothetical protein [Nocardia seriolae]MTJ87103.1 hypothetical protein [Nocardia seriolae]MTK31097.1 hypothetical protein [Nocardia seriolae]